tara:strand:+ start:199 stop:360 length:162 start_codon:yes stop_codon:yes gene_type:complete
MINEAEISEIIDNLIAMCHEPMTDEMGYRLYFHKERLIYLSEILMVSRMRKVS